MKKNVLFAISGMIVGAILAITVEEISRRRSGCRWVLQPEEVKAEAKPSTTEKPITTIKPPEPESKPLEDQRASEKVANEILYDTRYPIDERVRRYNAFKQMFGPKDQWRDHLLPLAMQWSGTFAVTYDDDPKLAGIITLDGKAPWKTTFVRNDGKRQEGAWRDIDQGIRFDFGENISWWLDLEQHRASPPSLRLREGFTNRKVIFTRLTPPEEGQPFSILRPGSPRIGEPLILPMRSSRLGGPAVIPMRRVPVFMPGLISSPHPYIWRTTDD